MRKNKKISLETVAAIALNAFTIGMFVQKVLICGTSWLSTIGYLKQLVKSTRKEEEKMEKLEDLENIVDTLSVLISETDNKELKSQLADYQEEFLIEKEELKTNLKAIQAEYEAEYRRDLASMRMQEELI